MSLRAHDPEDPSSLNQLLRLPALPPDQLPPSRNKELEVATKHESIEQLLDSRIVGLKASNLDAAPALQPWQSSGSQAPRPTAFRRLRPGLFVRVEAELQQHADMEAPWKCLIIP